MSQERSSNNRVSVGVYEEAYICAEWTSWELIRRVLKPAIEERRCRYVELPEMTESGIVGPASWKWGDLVAAIPDGTCRGVYG